MSDITNKKVVAERKLCLTAKPYLSEESATEAFNTLKTAHDRRAPKVYLATIIAAVTSMFLTARGLFDKTIETATADIIGILTAMMVAAAVSSLLTTASIGLMGIAMDAARRQRCGVIALATTFLVPVVGISTLNAIYGTSGAPSLVYDMQDKAEGWGDYVEHTLPTGNNAQIAKNALRPLKRSICSLAEAEQQRGVLSNSAGSGAISAAYESSCVSIGAILEALDEASIKSEQRRRDAYAMLDDLNSIPKKTELAVFDRQNAFIAKANAIKAIIGAAQPENLTDQLKAQLLSMEASVASLDFDKGQLGEKQQAAIQNLRSRLGKVSRTVGDLIEEKPKTAIQPPSGLLDTEEAVWAYKRKNTPQILMAFLVDLMGLWFCAMLMVSRSIPEARHREAQEQSDHQA